MDEVIVGSLDLEDDVPRFDRVAVVQRPNPERRPVVAAQLENCDRLVDPAEECLALAEHLHGDAGRVPIGDQQVAGAHEVLVAIVPRAHPLDGEVEDRRIEPGTPGR